MGTTEVKDSLNITESCCRARPPRPRLLDLGSWPLVLKGFYCLNSGPATWKLEYSCIANHWALGGSGQSLEQEALGFQTEVPLFPCS